MTGPSDLAGNWDLVAYHLTSPDGRKVHYPLGEGALGRLTYMPDGAMSVFLMATGRKALGRPTDIEGKAAAYDGIIAYCGTYEVSDGTIRHHVTLSSVPSFVDSDQVRNLTLEGDELTLRQTVERGEYCLVWRRAL